MRQAVRSLAVLGRLAIAGITDRTIEISPYQELIGREAEIIGVSDHLAQGIPQLIDYVCRGELRLQDVITKSIALDELEINAELDSLERFDRQVRVVITPNR